mmetsp:Transcript_26299/g.43071  ORF Transcript_26299/g.43071 Transcript_26299/m.43071 type:complete len:149 (-) Transcript_26299:91-537(-)
MRSRIRLMTSSPTFKKLRLHNKREWRDKPPSQAQPNQTKPLTFNLAWPGYVYLTVHCPNSRSLSVIQSFPIRNCITPNATPTTLPLHPSTNLTIPSHPISCLPFRLSTLSSVCLPCLPPPFPSSPLTLCKIAMRSFSHPTHSRQQQYM